MSSAEKDLQAKLETHEAQLTQTGVVVADLVIRITALERSLIAKGVIASEDFNNELKKVTSELAQLVTKFLDNKNNQELS